MSVYSVEVVRGHVISSYPGFSQVLYIFPDGRVEKSEPKHTVCVGDGHCIYCGRVFEQEAKRFGFWQRIRGIARSSMGRRP